VAGCNRPATPSHEFTKEEPASTLDSLPSQVWATQTPQSPLPSATADTRNTTVEFKNETANQAWNQYVDNFQAIKSLPAPQVQDPVSNPAGLTAYLNQLGNGLKALQQSRRAVESNLSSSEEKRRFRAAEKSLFESQDQEQQ
jgi:hypothetical protein